MRDRFSMLDRCAPIHGHVELRGQAMPEPARAHAENLRRFRNMLRRMSDISHHIRLHAVEHDA